MLWQRGPLLSPLKISNDVRNSHSTAASHMAAVSRIYEGDLQPRTILALSLSQTNDDTLFFRFHASLTWPLLLSSASPSSPESIHALSIPRSFLQAADPHPPLCSNVHALQPSHLTSEDPCALPKGTGSGNRSPRLVSNDKPYHAPLKRYQHRPRRWRYRYAIFGTGSEVEDVLPADIDAHQTRRRLLGRWLQQWRLVRGSCDHVVLFIGVSPIRTVARGVLVPTAEKFSVLSKDNVDPPPLDLWVCRRVFAASIVLVVARRWRWSGLQREGHP